MRATEVEMVRWHHDSVDMNLGKLWEMVNGITDSMDMSLGKLHDSVLDREAWCPAVHGVTKN